MTPAEINEKLALEYGKGDNNEPKWRVSWSDDQIEMRYGTYEKYSPSGLWIGSETGFRLVPKYRQWLPSQYVLEELTPTEGNAELTTKLSYEPAFAFRHLPPDWDVCKIVIEKIYENRAHRVPIEKDKSKEEREEELRKLEKYLFEDESDLTKKLHLKEAVVVPGGNDDHRN